MIYDRLELIPLSRFMRLYDGELSTLVIDGEHSEEELKKTSDMLIGEYLSIAGGHGIKSEVIRRNDMINAHAGIDLMNVCDNLMKMGLNEQVCEILKTMGYSLNPSDTDKINIRIKALLANNQFKLTRLMEDLNKPSQIEDKDHFSKEIAFVTTHYKMTIDKDKITAKEYAYIIKNLTDEIKQMKASIKKK